MCPEGPNCAFCAAVASARCLASSALAHLVCSRPRDNGPSRCPWPLRHIGLRVPTKILTHGLAPMQGGITCAILCFCMPNPCCDFRQAEAVGATRVETARSKLLRVPVPMGFRTR